MSTCCCCNETEDLEPVKLRGNTIAKYCKRHLALLSPPKKEKKQVVQVKEEEEWRTTKCCATPINSNGHCAVCGTYAL